MQQWRINKGKRKAEGGRDKGIFNGNGELKLRGSGSAGRGCIMLSCWNSSWLYWNRGDIRATVGVLNTLITMFCLIIF